MRKFLSGAAIAAASIASAMAAGPDHVDITWMSITNMHYQMGALGVVTDGYITRIPEAQFHGGGGGYAYTRTPWKPDVAAVSRVLEAIGGRDKVNLLLTGHSHWDHSFDTATWSKLTRRPHHRLADHLLRGHGGKPAGRALPAGLRAGNDSPRARRHRARRALEP